MQIGYVQNGPFRYLSFSQEVERLDSPSLQHFITFLYLQLAIEIISFGTIFSGYAQFHPCLPRRLRAV